MSGPTPGARPAATPSRPPSPSPSSPSPPSSSPSSETPSSTPPRRRGRTQPVVIDGLDHLTTAQAAAYLGVRTQTIYAYVSRGILAPTTIAGQRGSFFPLAQVADVGSRGRAPRSAAIGERIHTRISLIGPDDTLAYRGRDVPRLVTGGATYEDVCGLLWGCDPVDLHSSGGDDALVRAAVAALPPRARGIDVLKVCVDLLGAADPLRGDLRPGPVAAAGARILRAYVDALTLRTGATPLAPQESSALATSPRGWYARRLALALGGRDDPRAAALLDAALGLLADHDLAISTQAARVAASGRAHPYAVIGSALGAMDSPLHGMAPRAVHRLVGDAMEDLDAAVSASVATGEPPPGFGGRMYAGRDPRADTLAALLRDPATGYPQHPAVVAADQFVAAIADWADTFANSDLWLATLAHVLGWPAQAPELVFVIARSAGWIAHVLEEYQAEPLRYRIAGIYAGVRPDTVAAQDDPRPDRP